MRVSLLLILLMYAAQGLAQSLNEDQLKAAFLYRFSQFSTWPPPPLQEMNFCVIGNPTLLTEVDQLLMSRDTNLKIRALAPAAPEQLDQCQVLFLSQQDRQQSQYWLSELGDSPVLIVADTSEGFRQGAIIGLISGVNNLSFRVNLTDAKARGLSLSSHLLKLATEVR